MADAKISELTAAAAALGADEVPVNEAGTTKKVTITQVGTLLVGAHEALSDPHTGYRLESADHTHISTGLQGGLLVFIGAKAYATATQSIPSSTETALTFDSEEFDTDGFHSTVSNQTRFTVPAGKAGYYRLHAAGSANSSGSPQVFMKLNGTTNIRGSAEGTNDVNKNATAIINLAVADYVEAIAWQSSGGPLSWGHASSLHEQWTFTIQFLGT